MLAQSFILRQGKMVFTAQHTSTDIVLRTNGYFRDPVTKRIISLRMRSSLRDCIPCFVSQCPRLRSFHQRVRRWHLKRPHAGTLPPKAPSVDKFSHRRPRAFLSQSYFAQLSLQTLQSPRRRARAPPRQRVVPPEAVVVVAQPLHGIADDSDHQVHDNERRDDDEESEKERRPGVVDLDLE